MDWTAPYLVAAASLWAAVETAYIVIMTRTGRRHRALLAAPGRGARPTGVSALTPEELGLLVSGEQRLAEVALLRLYLDGRVVLDHDYLVLAGARAGSGEAATDDGAPTARRAILRKLGNGKRAILDDVVDAGKRAVHGGKEHRRLVDLGLWDEAAARNARTRRRAFIAYLAAVTFSLIAVAMSLGTAASHNWESAKYASAGAIVAFFAATMLVTGVASKRSGGQLSPATPAGTALLAELQDQAPEASGDSLMRYAVLYIGRGGQVPWDDRYEAQDSVLRFTAMHGLARLAMFAEALELGEPVTERGMSQRMKTFHTAAEIFSTVASLVSGGAG